MQSANISPITTPNAMLADAETMASEGPSPVRARSVISRAYYSAFHASLFKTGFTFDPNGSGGRHAQLIRMLMESSDRKWKSVGMHLNRLRGKRIVADYQLGDFMNMTMAEESLEDAKVIVIDLWEMG